MSETMQNESKRHTIKVGVGIEWMLSLPNMMDYITLEEGDTRTEDDIRRQLQEMLDDGQEYL